MSIEQMPGGLNGYQVVTYSYPFSWTSKEDAPKLNVTYYLDHNGTKTPYTKTIDVVQNPETTTSLLRNNIYQIEMQINILDGTTSGISSTQETYSIKDWKTDEITTTGNEDVVTVNVELPIQKTNTLTGFPAWSNDWANKNYGKISISPINATKESDNENYGLKYKDSSNDDNQYYIKWANSTEGKGGTITITHNKGTPVADMNVEFQITDSGTGKTFEIHGTYKTSN